VVCRYCHTDLKKLVYHADKEATDADHEHYCEVVTYSAAAWAKLMADYAEQIATGLVYIHEQSRPHLDLKCENILLAKSDDRAGYVCKLADFGMVYEAPTTADAQEQAGQGQVYGTWEYMPPECYQRQYGEPCFASDIYSFGLMLWEMVSRSRIYSSFPGFEDDDEAPSITGEDGKKAVDMRLIAQRLANAQRPKQSAGCPAVLHSVMEACWVHEKDDRPSAVDLLGVIKKIREDESEGTLAPPEHHTAVDREIGYQEFLSQLGLQERQSDLAEYLSNPGNELTELQQMDKADLDSDIMDDDDLGFSEAEKVQFRAAVEALPYGLPPDPYPAFLSKVGLQEKKADLAEYLSKPGNELIELTQMDPEDLDSDILDDDDLGLDDETKVKFRAAVAELRQSSLAAEDGGGSAGEPSDGTRRGAWSELIERYGGGSSAVSAEVAELREQLHASELRAHASELREQQKDNELHAFEMREQQKDNDLLKKDNDLLKRDEEIAALRQQLALARP
jgi:serine/threonine protein kinase